MTTARLIDHALCAIYGFSLADGSKERPRGGQELLMPEILSMLDSNKINSVWLPFSLGPLADECRARKIDVDTTRWLPVPSSEALYFGTPTIVNGAKLFPESDPHPRWHREKELAVSRDLCVRAADHKNKGDLATYRLIVSGLGTGDVSLEDRLEVMSLEGWSPPEVVVMKRFGSFVDYLIATARLPRIEEEHWE